MNYLKIKHLLLTIIVNCSLLIANCLHAQGIHFSQFNASALLLNPALTGQMEGKYRFTAQYRNQWKNITVPFITMASSFDINLSEILDEKLGAGIMMLNDQSGDGKLNFFEVQLSVAYHKPLDINEQHHLSMGLQGGWVQNKIDYAALTFPMQEINFGFDSTLPNGENLPNEQTPHLNLNAGILWTYHTKGSAPSNNYQVGFSLKQVNSPNASLLAEPYRLKPAYILHAKSKINLNKMLNIKPVLVFIHQKSLDELNIGADVEYFINNPYTGRTALFLGSRYRWAKQVSIVAGMEYKNFKLGVSYDVDVSPLEIISQQKGGFEISLIYERNPLQINPRTSVY